MIDTESLKKIIIDKATAGLLSSHFSGDSDVDEIIRKLPSKSNKRNKLLEQSFDYDEKYDIPLHWKWVKLGEISSYGDTPMKVMPSEMKENIWILELEDIESGGRLLTKKRYPDRKPAGEKTAFNKGQILYSKLRPYLKKVLIADEDGISTPELIAFDVFVNINAKYISYCLVNSYVDRIINQRSYGVKMPRVDTGFMANLPIPLPPLEEQERIVDLVERSIIEINNISMLQQQYESNLSILKSNIIDAGIRGKLTNQLTEDGDVETLYSQIQEEKAKLIKEGKIKKEKPIAEITKEEIPFEIPRNWKWVKLGKVISLLSGSDFTPDKYNDNGDGCPYMTGASNIENGKLIINRWTTSPNNISYINDLLLVCKGSGYGRTVKNNIGKIHIARQFMAFQTGLSIDYDYLDYFLQASVIEIKQNGQGIIPGIDRASILNMVFPLPPLAEQKRIAKTIEELLQIIG